MCILLESNPSKNILSERTGTDLKTDKSSLWNTVAITTARGRRVSSTNLANIPIKKMILHLTTLPQHLHCIPGNSEPQRLANWRKFWKEHKYGHKNPDFANGRTLFDYPNNMPSVWGLKSEARCEWVPMGNQIAAHDQHKQWDIRLREDLSKNENVGENKPRGKLRNISWYSANSANLE